MPWQILKTCIFWNHARGWNYRRIWNYVRVPTWFSKKWHKKRSEMLFFSHFASFNWKFLLFFWFEPIKSEYIRWEMTPTSIGGEKQASISGGSQSPIWYSLRQDYRGAQLKYVMQLHDAHLATRMPEHSWIYKSCMENNSKSKFYGMHLWQLQENVEHWSR